MYLRRRHQKHKQAKEQETSSDFKGPPDLHGSNSINPPPAAAEVHEVDAVEAARPNTAHENSTDASYARTMPSAQISPMSAEHPASAHARDSIVSPGVPPSIPEESGSVEMPSPGLATPGAYSTAPIYQPYRVPQSQSQTQLSESHDVGASQTPVSRASVPDQLHFGTGSVASAQTSPASTEEDGKAAEPTRWARYLSAEEAMSSGYRDT